MKLLPFDKDGARPAPSPASPELSASDAVAGYESLARIERLQPSFMRLHRAAVAGLEHDAARQAFVRTLVEFADRHGCRIIAEGVETAEEQEAVRATGVHLAQGYFVGRPAPVAQLPQTTATN